jgi:Asp-tRNA(Asn)/Glu-tRNA(Gln) amidotransferase A subunit family amidase
VRLGDHFSAERRDTVSQEARSSRQGIFGRLGGELAVGSTTLATGADIGGSIRWPAAACGVVGYKPPFGRNATMPPFNFDPYLGVGPLTGSVADTALFRNVVSGFTRSMSPACAKERRFAVGATGSRGFEVEAALAV